MLFIVGTFIKFFIWIFKRSGYYKEKKPLFSDFKSNLQYEFFDFIFAWYFWSIFAPIPLGISLFSESCLECLGIETCDIFGSYEHCNITELEFGANCDIGAQFEGNSAMMIVIIFVGAVILYTVGLIIGIIL